MIERRHATIAGNGISRIHALDAVQVVRLSVDVVGRDDHVGIHHDVLTVVARASAVHKRHSSAALNVGDIRPIRHDGRAVGQTVADRDAKVVGVRGNLSHLRNAFLRGAVAVLQDRAVML